MTRGNPLAPSPVASAPPSPHSLFRRNLRWMVAGMLCLVTIINYIDRQTLSVIVAIKPEQGGLSISPEQFGKLGMVFLLAYVAGQALGGIVMDKLGTRIGFAVILTWWSIATVCHRFAAGFRSFAFWRVMLGLAEAGNWPGAVKSISEWFPQKERGLATGIFNLGSSSGAIIAPPLVAWITFNYGWRNAFLLTGLIGFAWLIAWLRFYHLPRQHPKITEAELIHIESGQDTTAREERTAKLPWLQLLRYRQLWGMLVPRFLTEPVWWFYLFWLPTYLARERGLSLKEMAIGAALPYISADLGCLFGGGMSSYLIRRGWSVNAARKTVLVFSAFLMPAALFVVQAPSAWWAVALISVATFSHQSWSTNILTLPGDLFPPRVVGSVTGIQGVSIAASAIAQLTIGYVVARYSYGPVFTVAGLLHPTAAIVLLFMLGKIRQIEMHD